MDYETCEFYVGLIWESTVKLHRVQSVKCRQGLTIEVGQNMERSLWVVVGGVLLHKAIYLIHKRSQTLQASARARVGEVGRLDSCPLFTNREVAGTRLKAEHPTATPMSSWQFYLYLQTSAEPAVPNIGMLSTPQYQE